MRASHRNREKREFSVPEAAAILGQPQKRISNALARELHPLDLASAGQGIRRITSRGLLALCVLQDMESWFTPFVRRRLLSEVLKPSSGDAVSVEQGH